MPRPGGLPKQNYVRAARRLALVAVTLSVAFFTAAKPALAFAEAKWTWLTRCCCPDPAKCRCNGHKGHSDHDEGRDQPSLNKCTNTGYIDAVDDGAPAVPSCCLFEVKTLIVEDRGNWQLRHEPAPVFYQPTVPPF